MPSQADLAAVHEAALRVLERTDVLVHDDDAVAVLRARGARADGRRVFIGEGAVQAALAPAPTAFTLHGRSAARDVRFGDDHTVFGLCSRPAYVVDGGRLRSGTLQDLSNTLRLGHSSADIECQSDSIEALHVPVVAKRSSLAPTGTASAVR